jgi:hypothetical protein
MERKEYLLSELPTELRPYYDAMDFGVPLATVGFTAGGVRYRIYRDEQSKATAKAFGIDLTDALKGADVPAEEIKSAMEKLAMDPKDRDVILADIASLKGNKRATPAADISI